MSRFHEHVKTILKLDIFALGIMDISNRIVFSLSGGKNLLKPGGGKYYKWRYGDVFYHKYGEGAPLVLLHDLDPSFSSYEWTEVIDELSRHNTVYTVDLPGCGRSQKPNITYTAYYYVLFLRSFIKDIVKEECSIIASGYSSSFAFILSAGKKSMISRITAVNPRGLHDLAKTTGYKDVAASSLLRLPIIGTTVYNIAESRVNIDYRFTEDYMFNPFRSKDRYTDAFYESAHFNNGEGKFLLASSAGRKLTVDIRKALHTTDAEIVLIFGEHQDNEKKIAAQYKKHNDSVSSYIVKKTRQIPHMENPEEFISVYENSVLKKS